MIKKIYLALSYLLIVTDVVRCKPDYLLNDLAGGWLKLHTIPATWQEAFLRCHHEGAVLASPLDKQLADALHTLLTQSDMHGPIFLGTHDLFSKGDFVSVEGVPLSDMQITWGLSDIRPGDADCLTMNAGGIANLMYFSSCNDSLPYICYRKFDNLTMNECGTFDDEYHLNQRTRSCYKVHQKKQTWSSAYRICASEGGYLVILNDREEARIVKDMFPVRDGEVNPWEQFHIGLLAWGDDRTWTTIHGERIEDVFHDWHPGQPDNYNGNQDHATLLRAGTLDDNTPTSRAMFVCEKSPNSIRFESPPLDIDVSLLPFVIFMQSVGQLHAEGIITIMHSGCRWVCRATAVLHACSQRIVGFHAFMRKVHASPKSILNAIADKTDCESARGSLIVVTGRQKPESLTTSLTKGYRIRYDTYIMIARGKRRC